MKITPKEVDQKKLNDENLAEAVRLVQEAGFVVLDRILSQDWTEMVREAWEGHITGEKPADLLDMPFLDPMAIENPWGLQILEQIIGEDLWCWLPYHTNSTPPNWDKTQEVHRDQPHLFWQLPYAIPPHMMIIHIPLVDFTIENGSTEVWPGTHLIVDPAPIKGKDGKIINRHYEERASALPSIRTNMPAGSVVVRDMRVWHRAMPNRTNKRRTMLSLVYHKYFPSLPFHPIHAKPISQKTYDLLSERARKIFRFNELQTDTNV